MTRKKKILINSIVLIFAALLLVMVGTLAWFFSFNAMSNTQVGVIRKNPTDAINDVDIYFYQYELTELQTSRGWHLAEDVAAAPEVAQGASSGLKRIASLAGGNVSYEKQSLVMPFIPGVETIFRADIRVKSRALTNMSISLMGLEWLYDENATPLNDFVLFTMTTLVYDAGFYRVVSSAEAYPFRNGAYTDNPGSFTLYNKPISIYYNSSSSLSTTIKFVFKYIVSGESVVDAPEENAELFAVDHIKFVFN